MVSLAPVASLYFIAVVSFIADSRHRLPERAAPPPSLLSEGVRGTAGN